MKKFFTFFAAALMSVSMSAKLVQQDIALNQESWGWGYNSSLSFSEDGVMTCTLTGEWGAASTGWDPVTDLTGWDKIVILVENMNGCDGEWFKLKAYLRDKSENEDNQMEGLLGLDAPDNELNYLVIDLHQQKEGFDLTQARILAIQCQPNGAVFKISRVYLEKEVDDPLFDLRYEDKLLRITPNELGVQYFVFIEDKEYYDNRYQQYDQPTMQNYMDYVAGVVVSMGAQSSFVNNGDLNLNPDPIYHTWYDNDHMIVNHDYVAFVFKFENDARVGNVEYLAFTYAGEPQGIDNTAVDAKAVKIIRDGQVLILKNGKYFNALGTEVR